MKTLVSIEEAGAKLARLVDDAVNGEEIILTVEDVPVARLVPLPENGRTKKGRPQFGSAKGLIVHMAADFDAPLDDFREYME